MARRHSTNPFETATDDQLTFADVTMLVLLTVSAVAIAAVLLLGTNCAAHRLAAALMHA